MKRIPNPPRRCIFCDGTPISKEHVWADWMRDYLPRGQGAHVIQEGRFADNSHTLRPGPLNVKGDARSQKLKVVCGPCNNGWMSILQKTTKPILLPLLARERDIIQPHETKALAVWATMFAFVYASSMPDSAAQNAPQRRTFTRDKAPPTYWMYWCAPFDGLSSPAFHFGMAQSKNIRPMSSGDDAGDVPAVVDLTVCGAGGICFVIFGSNTQRGFQKFSQLVAMSVANAGFVQFWPSNEPDVRVCARRTTAFDGLGLLAFRNGLVNVMAHVPR